MDLKAHVFAELGDLINVYKQLHANPELSGQEAMSSKLVADQLEACGIVVNRNFGGHGVVGVLENGDGPTVMVRGDMDALPITEETGVDYASSSRVTDNSGNEVGIMHACGHDIHMTTLVGTARVLSKCKDHWNGKVIFVGQPAEEVGAGAKGMIESGLFNKFGCPDYCLTTHVIPHVEAGRITIKSGPIMAGIFQLKIIVRGVGGHGAIPHESKDPIVLAARIVTSLQTIISREISPLTPAVITIGSIHGGTRANIIPAEVVMEATVRFSDQDTEKQILEAIERTCRFEALSMGIRENNLPIIEFDETMHLPATINDSDLVDIVRESANENIGHENVMEAEMLMVSEDFSLFRSAGGPKISSCMFFTGAVAKEELNLCRAQNTKPPSLHNSRFCPPPEPTIKTAVTVMAGSVLKILQ
ncbi:amidohydrolase [Maridesulfovibrio sp.]|uniref:M20 metallopeptidase family protein n=1 Tax=Maridesulfovibrio sp. TaxID=2795000 RepID=UPI0029F487C8|nr:amidohydrolase [Maridesulfovibrio sp.]